MIQIAVTDDQVLFRKGLVSLINGFQSIRVIIEAGNGRELLEQMRSATVIPQAILLDLSMPELNGIETMKLLKQEFAHIPVIILTAHADDRFIVHAVELGANGYLVKDAEPQEVEKAITTVVSHDFYFNEQTIEAMRKGLISGKQKIALNMTDELTAREKEILQMICNERTTAEIAAQLFISERTVDGHRNNLLLKTGCRNTAGLVIFAVKHNLVKISP